MIIKHGDVVYASHKAHRLGEGMSEWCYNASGKPCAFLDDNRNCIKPRDVPSCSGPQIGGSIVWIREASDPFKVDFIFHPLEDYKCFCCDSMLPGVGSPNASTEALKKVGCAHFMLQGHDSKGRVCEWRICCVCMMALHDMGNPTCKEGMFRPAIRRVNPKSKEALAWNRVYMEAKRHGVMEAMVKRGMAVREDGNDNIVK